VSGPARLAGLAGGLALVAAAGLAAAQPSGSFDMAPRYGAVVAASEGRVLYVEARLVPPGRYYFAITVEVSRDSGAFGEPVAFSPGAFRFVARNGFVYAPALPGTVTPPAATCERASLPPGGTLTCDLVFQVPSDVTAGTLEFVPSAFDVYAVAVRIRE
jgi:hypothetical protein